MPDRRRSPSHRTPAATATACAPAARDSSGDNGSARPRFLGCLGFLGVPRLQRSALRIRRRRPRFARGARWAEQFDERRKQRSSNVRGETQARRCFALDVLGPRENPATRTHPSYQRSRDRGSLACARASEEVHALAMLRPTILEVRQPQLPLLYVRVRQFHDDNESSIATPAAAAISVRRVLLRERTIHRSANVAARLRMASKARPFRPPSRFPQRARASRFPTGHASPLAVDHRNTVSINGSVNISGDTSRPRAPDLPRTDHARIAKRLPRA